jgi:hypothetical protein
MRLLGVLGRGPSVPSLLPTRDEGVNKEEDKNQVLFCISPSMWCYVCMPLQIWGACVMDPNGTTLQVFVDPSGTSGQVRRVASVLNSINLYSINS